MGNLDEDEVYYDDLKEPDEHYNVYDKVSNKNKNFMSPLTF